MLVVSVAISRLPHVTSRRAQKQINPCIGLSWQNYQILYSWFRTS